MRCSCQVAVTLILLTLCSHTVDPESGVGAHDPLVIGLVCHTRSYAASPAQQQVANKKGEAPSLQFSMLATHSLDHFYHSMHATIRWRLCVCSLCFYKMYARASPAGGPKIQLLFLISGSAYKFRGPKFLITFSRSSQISACIWWG